MWFTLKFHNHHHTNDSYYDDEEYEYYEDGEYEDDEEYVQGIAIACIIFWPALLGCL